MLAAVAVPPAAAVLVTGELLEGAVSMLIASSWWTNPKSYERRADQASRLT